MCRADSVARVLATVIGGVEVLSWKWWISLKGRIEENKDKISLFEADHLELPPDVRTKGKAD